MELLLRQVRIKKIIDLDVTGSGKMETMNVSMVSLAPTVSASG